MVPSHAWRRRRRWAPTLAICHNTNKPVRPSKGVPGSGVAVGKLLLPFEIVPHPFAPCDSIKMSLSMVISDTGANAADVCRKPLVGDRHPRWPIKRVEFYLDDEPYSYRRNAPWLLGNSEWWSPARLTPGQHVLRVAAFDMRGPRFAES